MKRTVIFLFSCLMCMQLMAQSLFQQAQSAYNNGDFGTAWQLCMKQCEDNCTLNTKYLMMQILFQVNEFEACGQVAEALLKQTKKGTDGLWRSNCYVYMGVAAFEAGNLKKADKFYASAIKEAPENYWPYYERGMTNYHLGHHKQALTDLLTAHRLDSTDLNTVLVLAYVEEALKHPQESEMWYEKALAMTDRKSGRVYAERAVMMLQRGDSLSATQWLYDGMQVEPSSPRAGRVYNHMLHQCPQTMLQEALRRAAEMPFSAQWEAIVGDIYDETLNLPDSGLVHYYKANLLSASMNDGFNPNARLYKRFSAIEDFQACEWLMDDLAEADPYSLVPLRKRVHTAFEQQQFERAIELIDALLPLDKDNESDLRVQRAACLSLLNRHEEALQEYLRLTTDNSDSRYLNARIAREYTALGRLDAARASYQMVVAASEKYYNPKTKSVTITIGDGSMIPFELPLALRGLGEDNAFEVASANYLQIMMAKSKLEKEGQPGDKLDEYKLYNCACMFGLLDSASLALEILKLAAENGYCQPLYIEQDPDLRCLRETKDAALLADYQAFIAGLIQKNEEEKKRIYLLLNALDPKRFGTIFAE